MIELLYRLYARRLRRRLLRGPLPRHVAVVTDGNRRWARAQGFANPNIGHRYGAEHIDELLAWCVDLGIPYVTVYVCSSDNLRKRDADEVAHLMTMIEEVMAEHLMAPHGRWRVHVAGRLGELPDSTRHALKQAVEGTRDRGPFQLTIAVGYDGRQEIVDAVRALCDEKAGAGSTAAGLAAVLTSDDIAAHLYTSGRPDPDMVIRTSGEVRLSGFLLWQASHAQLYFCDAYWPGFRYVDFLRALSSYGSREVIDR
jgi:short-chain Z-isoprenyl diphosphate synthase